MSGLRGLGIAGLVCALLLTGCANTSVPVEPTEGGISGTGNRLDCTSAEARGDERCKAREGQAGELP